MKIIKLLFKFAFGLFLLGAIAFGLWQGLRSLTQASTPSVFSGRETVAEKRDIAEILTLTGDVRPLNQVEVRSEINGRIETIHVKEGDLVNRGDLLVTLDQTTLRTQLHEAQRNLQASKLRYERAKRDFNRLSQLRASEFIQENAYLDSKTDLELALIEFEIRQARLEASEEDLSRSTIRSPGSGVVTNLNVNEGQVIVGASSVSNGTQLMSVDDLSQMYIEMEVNEIGIQAISIDQIGSIRLDAIPDLEFEGKVSFIAPSARRSGNRRFFPVHIRFDTPDASVRPGLSASVTLPVRKVEDAVAVSVAAVFTENRERVVYVVGENGSLDRRIVQLGISDTLYVEIREGLEVGERISLSRPPRSA